ncbi:hypothetical protein [Mesorhizobium denitrificans]|uniref:Uncharacterized protein n=1 Tax=Mesorhizobium denitrificans TaxID=2294114 RepID=A0A371XEQ2_9HYPH|nr:hypothetical protein [Mesorhizobium denitrificans]RFC67707.1 hypothetical protein DY251_08885 [Mesorhizobium denitrificans]
MKAFPPDRSAAERQRRRRLRQRRGLLRLSFDVDEVQHVELLIASGYLRADQAEDREAINLATQRLNQRLAVADVVQ